MPKYFYISPKNKLKFDTGTFVEITGLKVRDFFDLESAKRLILENYRYALEPFGKIKLKINDIQVHVKDLEEEFEQFGKIKSRKELSGVLKIKGGSELKINGKVYILEFEPKSSRLKIDPGLDIVVFGKKICGGEAFKLEYNIKPNYAFAGYVRCDELIQIVKTSKDGLNKNTKIWSEFQKGIAKILEKYTLKKRKFGERKKSVI